MLRCTGIGTAMTPQSSGFIRCRNVKSQPSWVLHKRHSEKRAIGHEQYAWQKSYYKDIKSATQRFQRTVSQIGIL